MSALLTRTIEALSFVLLLTDYNMSELVAKCEPQIQKMFAEQTFGNLITKKEGMEVSSALVNVVIDQQIGQQLSVRINLNSLLSLLTHRHRSTP